MSGKEDKDENPPGAEAEAETEAEVFTMDYGTGQEMTIPTADVVVDPPDGGKAWCLVFFAMILASFREAFIVLQLPTLFFMKTMQSTSNSSADFGQSQGGFLPSLDSLSAEARTVMDTHNALFSISGILSGTLIVLIGYRLVALIGSVLTAVGYLGAAFSDISNAHLISFLYGAVPGIGHNLIVVAYITAMLEYFRRRRLVALLIPHVGAILGSLAFSIMSFLILGSFGINSWKSYLLFQAGVAGVMIPCSLFLKPLNARMKGSANQSLVSYMMGMDELKVFRSVLLYVFATVCCMWGGGIGVIEAKLPSFKGLLWFLPAGQLLVYVILLTSLVGTCFSCCISSNIRLRSVVIAMVVFSGILFVLNMMAKMLYDFIYAIVYSVLVGVLKGVGEPLLEYLIPLLLGDDNAAIGTGVLTFGQGLGSLSMTAIANEIEKSAQKVDGCFYLAGAIFFLSAVSIILAYRFHLRDTKRVAATDDPDEKPSQAIECTGMNMERF